MGTWEVCKQEMEQWGKEVDTTEKKQEETKMWLSQEKQVQ